MNRLTLRRTRDERGVVAIIVGLLAVVLLMFAAYAVDIGVQVNRKQMLNDTLDAAAQAGAFELPGSSTNARTQALAFATAHDASETGSLAPTIDFWCVVASTGTSPNYTVDASQIPSTCYPGPTPYTPGSNYSTTGMKVSCSAVLCAIPCVEPTPNTGTPKIACNTIRVYQGRSVPFQFGPAGGIKQGYTGSLMSVACKGPCGTIPPNPMNISIVADRTGSMSGTDLSSMVSGIKSMLQQMTPSQQYVSLGTIGRSNLGSTPTSEPSGSCASASTDPSSGAWVSVPFSDNYLNSGTTTINTSSALVKGVNCLTTHSSTGTSLAAPMKAAARYLLGSAPNNLSSLPARTDPPTKVLIFETDGEPNESAATAGSASLSDPSDFFSNNGDYNDSAPATTGPTAVGPNTPYPTQNRTTGTSPNQVTRTDTYKTTYMTTTKTITRTYTGGANACSNLLAVAANAKAQGILVITIAYNLGATTYCSGSNTGSTPSAQTVDGSPTITSVTPAGAQTTDAQGKPALNTAYAGNATINQTVNRTVTQYASSDATPDPAVKNVLAAAASPANGVPSDADNNCASGADQTAENGDGDYFFCASSGTDMASIFKTALGQVSTGIKLIKMP